MNRHFLYVLFLLFLSGCGTDSVPKKKVGKTPVVHEKITGACYEMPTNPVTQNTIGEVKRVNADWVALVPYGHTSKGKAEVQFSNDEGGWWGENVVGTTECIYMAHAEGLKTMLKPHVWIVGQGWPGYFDPLTEFEWLIWEQSYLDYILTYAKVAEDSKVDLFCIGTEYRVAVVKRPLFWNRLIAEVREIYHGPITYASNWDNYNEVPFWSKLDYIGVDAYFPLSEKASPSLQELKNAWRPIEKKLRDISATYQKPILFTEYGYRNIEYASGGAWRHSEASVRTSTLNQVNAYQALYETVWQNKWMAGGFFWKWHMYSDELIGGEQNRNFTPQGKAVEKTISKWYK